MAHAAEIDATGIVLRVVVVSNDEEPNVEQFCADLFGGRWVKTSYNGNIRTRFAGIGYTYDEARDVFIAPQPFPSWVLNDVTTEWEAPIPMPTDGKLYVWDEENLAWKEIVDGGNKPNPV